MAPTAEGTWRMARTRNLCMIVFSVFRPARAARRSYQLELCTERSLVRVCSCRGLLLVMPGLGARPI